MGQKGGSACTSAAYVIFRSKVLPRWKSRQIEDIRRGDVIGLAEDLIRDGKPVLANRVQALISSIFSFALDNEIISANHARDSKSGARRASGPGS
jgi:hypothetical protein